MNKINNSLSIADKHRYKFETEDDAKRIYKTEIYDAKQEGEALGIQVSRTQGIEEGKFLGIKDVVRKMKNFGLDLTLINEVTGLTEDEIDNIN